MSQVEVDLSVVHPPTLSDDELATFWEQVRSARR